MIPTIIFKAQTEDQRTVLGYYVRTGITKQCHYIALMGKEDLTLVEINPETLIAFTGKFDIKSMDGKNDLKIMFHENTVCAVDKKQVGNLKVIGSEIGSEIGSGKVVGDDNNQ